LKEDSLPVAMDLDTLETLDPVYDFEGSCGATCPLRASEDLFAHRQYRAFGSEARASE